MRNRRGDGLNTVGIRRGRLVLSPTHKDITLTGMAAVHRQRVGELEPWSDDRRTLCQAGDGDYYYGGSKVASRPQLGGKTLLQ